MLGALAIGALHGRIVQARLDNAGLEVVQHHLARQTAGKFKRVSVQLQPGEHGLVKDELHVLMALPRERHHEDPRAPQRLSSRVEDQSGVTEIHLSFRARRHFDSERHVRAGHGQVAHEAPDRYFPV